jgi:hypothetical protein
VNPVSRNFAATFPEHALYVALQVDPAERLHAGIVLLYADRCECKLPGCRHLSSFFCELLGRNHADFPISPYVW